MLLHENRAFKGGIPVAICPDRLHEQKLTASAWMKPSVVPVSVHAWGLVCNKSSSSKVRGRELAARPLLVQRRSHCLAACAAYPRHALVYSMTSGIALQISHTCMHMCFERPRCPRHRTAEHPTVSKNEAKTD